jgi:23S rRNA (guanosine2251-2'-O)-methyltransferase
VISFTATSKQNQMRKYRKNTDSKKRTTSKPAGRGNTDQAAMIYGRHAVTAALRNPARRIKALYVSQNAAGDFQSEAEERNLAPIIRNSEQLMGLLPPGAVHQGVVAHVDPLPELALADLQLDRPVIVLDQVTDPHNVGAILRSAAVFNAGALIMTRRNSPPLSGVLAKSACGGLEHVPVIMVGNLSQALKELAQLGFFRIGLAGEADSTLEEADLGGAIALVLGAEDKGMRRLTREQCDLLCRIHTTGNLASLNVSNAAAVALHTLILKA